MDVYSRGMVWVRERTDGVQIGYTSCTDSGVHEATYTLDEENADRLYNKLVSLGHYGDLETMIVAEFGKYLERRSLADALDDWDIEYETCVWVD